MKKLLWVFFLICTFSLNAQFAESKGTNPVDQLTGKVWMESEEGMKKAVLFGVDAAIAIEHGIAEKMAAQKTENKDSINYLSPFEKGWAKAFKDVSRDEIVQIVDKWYTDNPDQLARPVFSVIWFEIVEPKNK